jgi:hypothetical protein
MVYHSRMTVSVSIVCVYNDPVVRERCLDRSVHQLQAAEGEIEYLPVRNTDQTYSSAGAALNHGVQQARNDVVAFVHQDVFLHSATAIGQAASHLVAGDFGMLGAVGIDRSGLIIGHVRDRVVMLGRPLEAPVDVDSVDEVLFMATRQQLLDEPLTESPDLAWHAYAVEYGLRVRRSGQRVGVADIPLTHNSLTINLARLDEAHGRIAGLYADQLPVRTTCGVVARPTAARREPLFPAHRWRYPWLRESLTLQRARRAAGGGLGVLADIRRDVDDLLARAPGERQRLNVINCTPGGAFADTAEPLELLRRDAPVAFSSCAAADVPARLDGEPAGSWHLVTNLSAEQVRAIRANQPAASTVLGFHQNIGFWLLIGVPLAMLPPQWRSKRATPFGDRPITLQRAADVA